MFSVHDPIASVSLPRNKRASENNTDRSWETIRFIFSSKMVRWPLSVKQLTSDFTNVANSGIHNGARSSHCRSCIGIIPLCILVILVVSFLQVPRYQYKHGESVTLSISVISVFWLPCKSKTGLTPVLFGFWFGTVSTVVHVQPNTTSKQRTR